MKRQNRMIRRSGATGPRSGATGPRSGATGPRSGATGPLGRRFARTRSEHGQSTTEYVLVLLVAATIALLLLNWAKGGAIVGLFQTIFDKVVAMFS